MTYFLGVVWPWVAAILGPLAWYANYVDNAPQDTTSALVGAILLFLALAVLAFVISRLELQAHKLKKKS